jgi:hypothetical protein
MDRNLPDPKLESKLTKEAQDVVDTAASSMENWINENLEKIKADLNNELVNAANELKESLQNTKKQKIELENFLSDAVSQLKEKALNAINLKPADENQKVLIQEIVTLSEKVKAELRKMGSPGFM